jgi:C-terminal processing protease CtpA/Prc
MHRFAQDRFTPGDGTEVATKLAATLERHYVYLDLGAAYANALRRAAARGAYADIDSPETLATVLTSDLQRVHRDLHLKVLLLQGAAASPRSQDDRIAARWVAPGIALIRLDEFLGDDADLRLLRSLLDRYATAGAIIIDLRDNGGGGLREMDVIFSRIFSREQPLVESESRLSTDRTHPSPFAALPTVRQVTAPSGLIRRQHFAVPAGPPTPLRQAKVFVLTSRRTASAAEHMAFGLKLTRRGTVIGERTAGAGHFGDVAVLGHGLGAFIPMGRGYDPMTGKGWEGVGVQPDLAVPAVRALEEALRHASAR